MSDISIKNRMSYHAFFLFLYHTLFTILAYKYIQVNSGDANLYWFQNNAKYLKGKTWLDFFNYGTDVILFINYPLANILKLPVWFGCIIYGTIGLFGIFQFKKLVESWMPNSIKIFDFNVLLLLYVMPNLHFWTATIGKEAICFLCIATILLKVFQNRYASWQLVVGALLLLLIRPHVFLMLGTSIIIIELAYNSWSFKKRLMAFLTSLMGVVLSFYMFLQLSKIKILNWERLKHFNDYSILSFKDSGSYVPMLEYNYVEKIFAFYFRPLFFDTDHMYGLVLSIENLLYLLLHIFVLFIVVKYWRVFKTDKLFKIILLFTIISVLLYVQRYAGLGIFVRTKVMIQPFTIMALVWLLNCICDKKTLTIKN